MTAGVLLAFGITCVVLALTPGPNMSLIVANTMSGGLVAGLFTLAGSTTGLAVLVTIAALGMTSVMALTAQWFDYIRWVGAVYLVYLGATQLIKAYRGGTPLQPATGRGAGWYAQGLLVSLSNPKVLLFLGAFLPQFVDPARPAQHQLAILGIMFVGILALVDCTYTVALARTRQRLTQRWLRVMDATAGGLLLAGGAVLALMRRP